MKGNEAPRELRSSASRSGEATLPRTSWAWSMSGGGRVCSWPSWGGGGKGVFLDSLGARLEADCPIFRPQCLPIPERGPERQHGLLKVTQQMSSRGVSWSHSQTSAPAPPTTSQGFSVCKGSRPPTTLLFTPCTHGQGQPQEGPRSTAEPEMGVRRAQQGAQVTSQGFTAGERMGLEALHLGENLTWEGRGLMQSGLSRNGSEPHPWWAQEGAKQPSAWGCADCPAC